MSKQWESELKCAAQCGHCQQYLETKDRRVLSVYDHQPICTACKQAEEQKPDYDEASKSMISKCLEDTDRPYGDPGSYCFYHFVAYKC